MGNNLCAKPNLRKCIIFAAIMLTSQFAYADEANQAACASVSDPAKRLECFDNANKKSEIPDGKIAAQEAVMKRLKDPGSARFGRFTEIAELACLGINARNAMGGYTGEQQAVLMNMAGSWIVIGIHDVSHDKCVDVAIPIARRSLSKK